MTFRTFRSAALIISCIVLFASTLHADATELDRWFRRSDNAGAYEDRREAIVAIVQEAQAQSLPAESLVKLVQEGAAKRVPPDRLIAALIAERDRLEAAVRILESHGHRSTHDVVERLAIAQRGGVTPALLDSIARAAEGADQTVAAAEAVMQLYGVARVDSAHAERLALALVETNTPISAYRSVPALVLKGRAAGLSPEETMEIIGDTLRAGRGLVHIDQEISRRGRSR